MNWSTHYPKPAGECPPAPKDDFPSAAPRELFLSWQAAKRAYNDYVIAARLHAVAVAVDELCVRAAAAVPAPALGPSEAVALVVGVHYLESGGQPAPLF